MSARRLTAIQNPNAKEHRQADLPSITIILLTLVRLAARKSDILITINIPYSSQQIAAGESVTEEDKLSSLILFGLQYQDKIHRSFRINDWSLFG